MHPGAAVALQGVDGGQLLIGQLEAEDVEVRGDSLRGHRLGEQDAALLQVPADDDLRRGDPVGLGRLDDGSSPKTAPWASGLHAWVLMPYFSFAACASRCCRAGWISIWLIAGVLVPVSATRSRWCGRKLETPMLRVSPSSCSSSRPFQAPGTSHPQARASGSGRGPHSPAPASPRRCAAPAWCFLP